MHAFDKQIYYSHLWMAQHNFLFQDSNSTRPTGLKYLHQTAFWGNKMHIFLKEKILKPDH